MSTTDLVLCYEYRKNDPTLQILKVVHFVVSRFTPFSPENLKPDGLKPVQ